MKKVLIWLGYFFLKLLIAIVIGVLVIALGYVLGEKWAHRQLPKNDTSKELRDLNITYRDKSTLWYSDTATFYIRNENLIVESHEDLPRELDCKIDMNTCGFMKDLEKRWEHTYNLYHNDGRTPSVIFRNDKHQSVTMLESNSGN